MTTDAPRKPRLGLMGEFSAGKSTLTNLLLGARPLPEKVTATRLSPVWISYGHGAPYRVDVYGTTEPVELSRLEEVPVEETRVIRIEVQSPILEDFDLIDFPGISDPNMDSVVWERMVEEVDAILWCTHATQAWRQSEAAAWDTIPPEVQKKSVLVVTRFDKLKTERDRARVLARLNHETEGLFSGIYPVELLRALAAGTDEAEWQASGAGALMDRIAAIATGGPIPSAPPIAPAGATVTELPTAAPEPVPAPSGGPTPRRVIPRRVAAEADGGRLRLVRRDGDNIADAG